MPSLLTRFSVGAGGEDLTADSALVARSIGSPGSVAVRPPANPVPDAAHAGTSPITHVVYIVRENRTFDQEYGDLGNSRSDVNADPLYQMLPSATPQGHAITNRYAFSDNFFSDGEASVQGHWWTSSANVDGHRNVVFVASPYAKQTAVNTCTPGYVSHTRIDQASVIRTMELILGLPALSSYDQGATPLHDMFQDKNSPARLSGSDLAPFTPASNPPFINETVASLPKTAATRSLMVASALVPKGQDHGGPLLEKVLWQSATNRAVPAALTAEIRNQPRAGNTSPPSAVHLTTCPQPPLPPDKPFGHRMRPPRTARRSPACRRRRARCSWWRRVS